MTLEKRIWLWDFILLALLSAGLRFHHLDTLSFREDEARTALRARFYSGAVQVTAQLERPSPREILYPWIEGRLFRSFGESEWLARLPAAACGVVTTALVYLWGSHWFGPWTGRWAALLYAVAPPSVEWGRSGVSRNLEQLLFVLLIICAWKFLERNHLDAPFAEAPKARGPRPSTLGELARLAPCLALLLLIPLVNLRGTVLFTFVPVYLLIRLVWSWRRGGVEDAEFDRTKNCLYVLMGGFGVVAGTLYLLDPLLVRSWFEGAPWRLQVAQFVPPVRENSDVLILAARFAGFIILMGKSLPGWLVLCSIAGPLSLQTLLGSGPPAPICYSLLPSFCLLAGCVLGWASTRLEGFIGRFSVKPKFPNLPELGGGLVVVCGLYLLADQVFLSERSSAAILTGNASAGAGTSPDFRGMAEWAQPFLEEAVVISTDPVLSDYYLGRTDFVYPYGPAHPPERPAEASAKFIPNAETLVKILREQPRGVIVGSRDKFEESLEGPEEAERLWKLLNDQSAETWEGDHEVGFVWIGHAGPVSR